VAPHVAAPAAVALHVAVPGPHVPWPGLPSPPAPRYTVALRTQFIAVDFWRIKASISDLASVDTSELEKVASLFRGQFLDDLSLPRCPEFEAWRISCMNDVRLCKAQILRTLIDRFEKDASRALPYERALHAI
jgi:hypothetical protein